MKVVLEGKKFFTDGGGKWREITLKVDEYLLTRRDEMLRRVTSTVVVSWPGKSRLETSCAVTLSPLEQGKLTDGNEAGNSCRYEGVAIGSKTNVVT